MAGYKETRASDAKKHLERMQKMLGDEIKYSIERTEIFNKVVGEPESTGSMAKVQVVARDTVSAVMDLKRGAAQGKKVAALNFASFRNPGGGFLNGAMAQEEALCSETTLYPVLNAFRDTYYAENEKLLHRGLYDNRALYSPAVCFVKGNQVVKADIITCAAPNLNAYTGGSCVPDGDAMIALNNRCKLVTSIAKAKGVEWLVLGAWGCGVFGWHPKDVVLAFQLALDDYHLTNVVFAIPGMKGDPNLAAFRDFYM